MPCHKERTVSGTLVALSHSIRLRPGAHTGAECVLRATYQGRGNRREAGKQSRERPDRVTDRDRERGVRGGERKKTKPRREK